MKNQLHVEDVVFDRSRVVSLWGLWSLRNDLVCISQWEDELDSNEIWIDAYIRDDTAQIVWRVCSPDADISGPDVERMAKIISLGFWQYVQHAAKVKDEPF